MGIRFEIVRVSIHELMLNVIFGGPELTFGCPKQL